MARAGYVHGLLGFEFGPFASLHSGSKAQDNGDSSKHGWKDPYVSVVFGAPNYRMLHGFLLAKVCNKPTKSITKYLKYIVVWLY